MTEKDMNKPLPQRLVNLLHYKRDLILMEEMQDPCSDTHTLMDTGRLARKLGLIEGVLAAHIEIL